MAFTVKSIAAASTADFWRSFWDVSQRITWCLRPLMAIHSLKDTCRGLLLHPLLYCVPSMLLGKEFCFGEKFTFQRNFSHHLNEKSKNLWFYPVNIWFNCSWNFRTKVNWPAIHYEVVNKIFWKLTLLIFNRFEVIIQKPAILLCSILLLRATCNHFIDIIDGTHVIKYGHFQPAGQKICYR